MRRCCRKHEKRLPRGSLLVRKSSYEYKLWWGVSIIMDISGNGLKMGFFCANIDSLLRRENVMRYKRLLIQILVSLDEMEEKRLFRQLYIMVQRHITREEC